MTDLGLANHELAEKADTSRQAIYKLRKGLTRMLPEWAKRLAPHLGVSWQELVEGMPLPQDKDRADLLAAYDALDDEQRRAILIMVRGMARRDNPSEDEPSTQPKRRAAGCVVPVTRLRGR